MSWLDDGTIWLIGAFLLFLTGWFRNLFSIIFPSPQRMLLALSNVHRKGSIEEKDKIRFILAWLENDHDGKNTAAISNTFADLEGIELCRSARIVSASGAADAWRADMRKKGKKLLLAWTADVAIVGRVDKDRDAVSLWFISSGNHDTFGQASNNPYMLRFNRLGDDFFVDINSQISALALSLTIPKETSGNLLQMNLQKLKTTVPKLENLFRTVTVSEDRVSLGMVYALAQSVLGEWLGETESLRSAIEKSREVLEGTDCTKGTNEFFISEHRCTN